MKYCLKLSTRKGDVDQIIRKAKEDLSDYVKQDHLIRLPRIGRQQTWKVTNC